MAEYVTYKIIDCPKCAGTKTGMPSGEEGGPLVEDLSLGPIYKCEICGHLWREKFEDVVVRRGKI